MTFLITDVFWTEPTTTDVDLENLIRGRVAEEVQAVSPIRTGPIFEHQLPTFLRLRLEIWIGLYGRNGLNQENKKKQNTKTTPKKQKRRENKAREPHERSAR